LDAYPLKPAELVDMLGVSRSWLYDAAKEGRIPCVRLGGDDGPVRFRLRDIEQWLEAGPVPREPASRSVHEPQDSEAPTPQRRAPRRDHPTPDAGGQLRLLPPAP
jgi:excisionase family DNA binding protein